MDMCVCVVLAALFKPYNGKLNRLDGAQKSRIIDFQLSIELLWLVHNKMNLYY